MFKVEIVLDEEKILREGQNLDEMWLNIDNQYTKYGLRRMSKGLYLDAGRDSDWGSFWAANMSLRKNKIFRENVVKWHWYNSYDAEIDAKYTGEDLIKGYNEIEKELGI